MGIKVIILLYYPKATHYHFDCLSSPNKPIREGGYKWESEKEKIDYTQKFSSTYLNYHGGVLEIVVSGIIE